MEALKINHDISIEYEITELIKKKYPGRNKKYYSLLLLVRQNLIKTPFELSLTTDKIIQECQTARPTWYSYFKNTEDFYQNVFSVLSESMLEHALIHLRNNAFDYNWTSVARSLKMLVFLSNTKDIASYFESIRSSWYDCYNKTVESYAGILGPILKLSAGRGLLFMRNIANELIIHPEKYYTNLDLFNRFVQEEHQFFLSEQNS
jgi:hypothetical protein